MSVEQLQFLLKSDIILRPVCISAWIVNVTCSVFIGVQSICYRSYGQEFFAVRKEFIVFIVYLEYTQYPCFCVCCVNGGKAHLLVLCNAWNQRADVFWFPAKLLYVLFSLTSRPALVPPHLFEDTGPYWSWTHNPSSVEFKSAWSYAFAPWWKNYTLYYSECNDQFCIIYEVGFKVSSYELEIWR